MRICRFAGCGKGFHPRPRQEYCCTSCRRKDARLRDVKGFPGKVIAVRNTVLGCFVEVEVDAGHSLVPGATVTVRA